MLFLVIVIYWLSAVPVINNKIIPIIATLAYAVIGIAMVLTLGLPDMAISVIGDLAIFSSCCIIICNGMKYRL